MIVNWNRPDDTIECLTSVFQLDHPEVSVVLVDNGSTDDSIEKIWAWAGSQFQEAGAQRIRLKPNELTDGNSAAARFVLIDAGSNLGFAGGCNLGVTYGRASTPESLFWFLNNDTVVAPDALKELIASADGERVGIVGSKLLYYRQPSVIQAAGGGTVNVLLGTVRYQSNCLGAEEGNQSPKLDYIMGASMLVRSEVFDDVGMLDPMYFLGWEEADFCTRAARRGWNLGYAWKSRVWHKDSATIGFRSKLADYYGVRNSVIYLRRFHPWAVAFAFLLALPLRVLRRLARGEFGRIPLIVSAYRDGLTFKLSSAPQGLDHPTM